MNREQFLSKRMWRRGAAADACRVAEACYPQGDDDESCPGATRPAASLVDHYRRLHRDDDEPREVRRPADDA